ncbi:hypothetical protein LOTGIDRAFT_159824 [Lottia gigantea]|uniref:Choice-of-anchor I domain-containing protein n=1 Tax=Lottia gigantea TaxID=225164 RepID=V4ANT0_LOTGI|nr:hypothetical protein LOTGIDRAFT_159824 [Lottia gigantea]ESO96415.1 hypothetical protein LOTGIDRAFT_159824 [Lottia gigantea]
MVLKGVLGVLALSLSVYCDVVLEERGYLQLPDRNNFLRFDSGTAGESAVDVQRKVLYVVGHDTAMLHVINVNNVDSLTTILSHNFNPATEGKPLDVEFCSTPTSSVLAISFSSPLYEQAEGHVILYEHVSVGNPVLVQKNPTDPQITVGPHPENIKFTSDCALLIVSNEGIPGEYDGKFVDPPGSVSIISVTVANTPISTVSFSEVDTEPQRSFLLNNHVRWMLRTEPNTNIINPFSNNIEPEYITISPNNAYAYVTLQENNAIAKIDLENGYVNQIYPLGVKEWRYSTFDGSDGDSGIILKKHNISSFYQPDKIAFFEWKNRLYLITADEGKEFSVPIYFYTDFDRAKNLHTNGEFLVDPELDAELADDAQLGRLFVSQFHDGRATGSSKINRVFTFGGRGFSVFDANNMIRQYESGDEIEKYSRLFHPNVFNGDCSDANLAPFQEMDFRSTLTGPSLNAIVDGDFLGRKLLIFGSGTNGILYVYELVNPVSSRAEMEFQSVHRRGSTLDTWGKLYSSGIIGDAGIEDLSFIPQENSPVTGSPVLLVVSSKSGSVSAYTFKDQQFPKGVNGNGGICQPTV